MKWLERTALGKLHVFVITAFFMQSCGMIHTASPSQSCGPNTVVVQVYTGSIVRVCGCQEPNNVSFGSGNFICTAPVGATVFFYYPAISSPHLISITGGPNDGSLGYHAPGSGEQNPADSYILHSTGTIQFFDFYQTDSVSGSFIVQ